MRDDGRVFIISQEKEVAQLNNVQRGCVYVSIIEASSLLSQEK